MFRSLVCLALGALALVPAAKAAETAPPGAYARVDVAPTKTSIYIGTVTMTMPALVRRGDAYEADYTAKVFPYFFYNESGRFSIDIPDEQLRALERGESVEFKGHGVRSDGAARRVEGRATPADPRSGKLKIRVFVSKRTELIFNTTYRFLP